MQSEFTRAHGLSLVKPSTTQSRSHFLTTARVGFGWWRQEDVQLALDLWCDDDVMRFCNSETPSPEKVRLRLQTEIQYGSKHRMQYWPIFRLADGAHLGCCGLHPFEGEVEIGYYLRPEFWGQGYAVEAAAAIVEFAFETLNLEILHAETHPENAPSQQVLQKIGFVRKPGSRFYEPLGIPLIAFSLSRSEFVPKKTLRARGY